MEIQFLMIWSEGYSLGLSCIAKIKQALEGRCPLYLTSYQWPDKSGIWLCISSYSLAFEIINSFFFLKVNLILISLMDLQPFQAMAATKRPGPLWVYLNIWYEMYLSTVDKGPWASFATCGLSCKCRKATCMDPIVNWSVIYTPAYTQWLWTVIFSNCLNDFINMLCIFLEKDYHMLTI